MSYYNSFPKKIVSKCIEDPLDCAPMPMCDGCGKPIRRSDRSATVAVAYVDGQEGSLCGQCLYAVGEA